MGLVEQVCVAVGGTVSGPVDEGAARAAVLAVADWLHDNVPVHVNYGCADVLRAEVAPDEEVRWVRIEWPDGRAVEAPVASNGREVMVGDNAVFFLDSEDVAGVVLIDPPGAAVRGECLYEFGFSADGGPIIDKAFGVVPFDSLEDARHTGSKWFRERIAYYRRVPGGPWEPIDGDASFKGLR